MPKSWESLLSVSQVLIFIIRQLLTLTIHDLIAFTGSKKTWCPTFKINQKYHGLSLISAVENRVLGLNLILLLQNQTWH